tara:strand:+ start:189 stop:719 length:531 start_codon:yes stop_codon:yes gene_type:complete
MEKNKIFLLFNGFSLYVYWWVSFWGASNNNFYVGPVLAITYFVFHFCIISNKKKELHYMLFCILFGLFLESLFYYTGFLDYRGIVTQKYSIIPIWILILWAGYSLTVFHSFRWIYGRYYLSVILGGLFAPLIYLSGGRTGCIILNYDILTSYLVLVPIWSLSFLLLNYFSVRINEK